MKPKPPVTQASEQCVPPGGRLQQLKYFSAGNRMTNAYHFDGLIVLTLLVICTCAYMRGVPRLKQFFLSEKKGLFGALYKAAVIGTRLHWAVASVCVATAVYIMFVK